MPYRLSTAFTPLRNKPPKLRGLNDNDGLVLTMSVCGAALLVSAGLAQALGITAWTWLVSDSPAGGPRTPQQATPACSRGSDRGPEADTHLFKHLWTSRCFVPLAKLMLRPMMLRVVMVIVMVCSWLSW